MTTLSPTQYKPNYNDLIGNYLIADYQDISTVTNPYYRGDVSISADMIEYFVSFGKQLTLDSKGKLRGSLRFVLKPFVRIGLFILSFFAKKETSKKNNSNKGNQLITVKNSTKIIKHRIQNTQQKVTLVLNLPSLNLNHSP